VSDLRRAEELQRKANALAGSGDHAGALALLIEIAALPDIDDETRGWALHGAGHAAINAGRPREADPFFERIAALAEPHPHCLCEAHVAIGYGLAASGRHVEARAAFERAFAVEEGLPCHRASARFHLAKSYRATGQEREARAALEAFLAMPEPYAGELREAKRLIKRW
jgi:tetratricopeptide (TPR) repeat protein